MQSALCIHGFPTMDGKHCFPTPANMAVGGARSVGAAACSLGAHRALPAAALGPEGGRRPQAAHTPHFALSV